MPGGGVVQGGAGRQYPVHPGVQQPLLGGDSGFGGAGGYGGGMAQTQLERGTNEVKQLESQIGQLGR